MSSNSQFDRPVFGTPTRWALRVLAWTAFGISAYLAWHAATGSAIAGCGVGSQNGCDVVLSSSWSKWLDGFDVPVAVLGLACYASLAGLSVLLGLQNPRAGRWISTAFVMLAAVAAGASLWFLGIQIFAIGRFCPYCIVVDLCGVAIGGLAIGSVARWLYAMPHVPQPRVADASFLALRTALPTGTQRRPMPTAVAQESPRPSLAIALGGAVVVLAVFIGGQIVFPSKTYSVQAGALEKPIELVGSTEPVSADQAQASQAQPHVAMRIPSESIEEGDPTDEASDKEATADNQDADAEDAERESIETSVPTEDRQDETSADLFSPNAAESTATEAGSSTPGERERLVKFLNGTLTLDVYKHAHIGSPEAPHVMVEMVSYDCPHCRKMHHTMQRGLARYGDQLAIIVMPVPLEMGCNKLVTDRKASHRGACSTARFALGVAALRPSSFHKFHHWLMSGDKDKPPTLEDVIPKAYGMVDADHLRELTRSPEINKQIAEYVDLFGKLGRRAGTGKDFGLPVQILGDHVLAGTVEKEKDVFAAWEEHLGVEPR